MANNITHIKGGNKILKKSTVGKVNSNSISKYLSFSMPAFTRDVIRPKQINDESSMVCLGLFPCHEGSFMGF